MKRLQLTALATAALATILPTPTLADDPISPQPGAKETTFSIQENVGAEERWQMVSSGSRVAIVTTINTKGNFTKGANVDTNDPNYDADTCVWEGFLLSKSAGLFTFTVSHSAGSYISLRYRNGKSITLSPANQFAIQINQQTFIGNGSDSFNVRLDAGYNSVKIMATMWTGAGAPSLAITYKPANSTVQPRAITPATLFHEEEETTDEDW